MSNDRVRDALHLGDNASLAFGSAVYALVGNVRESIGALTRSRKLNEYAPGSLHALAKLCKEEPQLLPLNRGEVEEWRSVFFRWLDRIERKQPPEARAAFRSAANNAFDTLLDASTDWPESQWRSASRERSVTVVFPDAEARHAATDAAEQQHPVELGSALHAYLHTCIAALTGAPNNQRTALPPEPPCTVAQATVDLVGERFSLFTDTFMGFTKADELEEDHLTNAYDLEAAIRAELSPAHADAVEFDCESSLFTLHTEDADALAACLATLSKLASAAVPAD
jgi:hypothetical protein